MALTPVSYLNHRDMRLMLGSMWLAIRRVSGAAPLPYIYQIPENTKIVLECTAQGVPKPELEWRDSSGTAVPVENGHLVEHAETSGRFHVELRVIVTSSDNYTCVVTQKEIYHQIKNTLIVHFKENKPGLDAMIGWVVAGILGVILLIVITACYCFKKTCRSQTRQIM